MANEDGTDYKTEVQKYSDEELLSKERSKRRRKTGDVVGTGLSAVAAVYSPALWAVAGGNAKSFLSNSSKHKIIMDEISRRGLKPIKGDFSDTILPILTSAGTMAVGRVFGGAAGQGVASMAGNVMHSVGNRAMGGVPKDQRKDKASKKVSLINSGKETNYKQSRQQTSEIVSNAPQAQILQTPSVYQVPTNQAPPATLVFHYVPPSAQYPKGYYAPAPVQTAAPPAFQQALVIQQQQQQPMMVEQAQQYEHQQHHQHQQHQQQYQPQQHQQQYQHQQQQHQQMPPALAYQYAPPEPQYYQDPPQQMTDQRGIPYPGVNRGQTIYDPPPTYQPRVQRAQTIAYR